MATGLLEGFRLVAGEYWCIPYARGVFWACIIAPFGMNRWRSDGFGGSFRRGEDCSGSDA